MSIVNDIPVFQAALAVKKAFCALRAKSDYPLDDQIASWRHLIVTGHKTFAAGETEKAVGSFTVPANCSWVVTHVAVIAMAADGALSAPALNISAAAINLQNFTTPDSLIWFEDGNGTLLTPQVSALGYQAQQVLTVFAAGTQVNLMVSPLLGAGEATQSIFSAISGFLIPPGAADTVASINTQWFPSPEVPPAAAIIGSLRIIDVENPAAPTLVATVAIQALPGANETLAFGSDHICYTLGGQPADVDNRLSIVDTTNRNAPVILSEIQADQAGAGFYRLVESGNNLFVVRANVGNSPNIMQVYDVSDKAAPVSVATYNMDTGFAVSQANPDSAIRFGTTLIVASTADANTTGRLGFYNISNPLAVTQTTVTTVIAGAANDLAFSLIDASATRVYLRVSAPSLGIANELRIYDITNPAAPALLGSLAVTPVVFSQVDNNKIYGIAITAANKNLYIFNVSNPAAPSLTSTTLMAGINTNFSIRGAGNKAYIANKTAALAGDQIQIFDTAIPAAPVLLGTASYNPASGARSSLVLDL